MTLVLVAEAISLLPFSLLDLSYEVLLFFGLNYVVIMFYGFRSLILASYLNTDTDKIVIRLLEINRIIDRCITCSTVDLFAIKDLPENITLQKILKWLESKTRFVTGE